MKKFTLKYYPPEILISIIAITIGLNFLCSSIYTKYISKESLSTLKQLLSIIGSTGVVGTALALINNYVMWDRLLKLLHLCDARGQFEGELISSYHIDDDTTKAFVTKHLKLKISQNINGLWVKGEIFNYRHDTTPTSTFTSTWSDIEENEDDTYKIMYLYGNEGNTLHDEHRKYGLNNHKGFTCLIFDSKKNTMNGYYFTHERGSHGQLTLTKTA